MKNTKVMVLALCLGVIGLFGLKNAEAKGRGGHRSHYHASSHSRRITTTKNGVTRTRTIHVAAH